MESGKVKITKWAYLKTPLYSWTFHNTNGGIFSNSGMHRSFNKCIEHARSVNGIHCKIETFLYDGENEVKIQEMSNCYGENMKPTTEKTLKEIEQIEKEIFGNVSTVEFIPPEVVAEIIRDEVTIDGKRA